MGLAFSPAFQKSCCPVLQALYYLGGDTPIEPLVNVALGEGAFRYAEKAETTQPYFAVASGRGGTVVFIDGISNLFQTFSVVAGNLPGLTFLPGRDTNAQFMAAAQELSGRLIGMGFLRGEGVTLVGHSYGGGVALCLAMLLRQMPGQGSLSVLTYGSPMPGNTKAAEFLQGVEVLRLMNDNDPVPLLPNLKGVPFLAGEILELFGRAAFADYVHPGSGLTIRANGDEYPMYVPDNAPTAFLTVSENLRPGGRGWFGKGHDIREYGRRLELAFPERPQNSPPPARSNGVILTSSRELEALRVTGSALSAAQRRQLAIVLADPFTLSTESKMSASVPLQYKPQVTWMMRQYYVSWMGKDVAVCPTLSKGKSVCNYIMKLMTRLQVDCTVDPVGFPGALADYIAAATAGGNGFAPQMNAPSS